MSQNKILGLKIKELRSRKSLLLGKKITQQDLADELGISRSYIGDIESGRTVPSKNLLEKIAKTLDVPIAELDMNTNDAITNIKISSNKSCSDYKNNQSNDNANENYSNTSTENYPDTLKESTLEKSLYEINKLAEANKISCIASYFDNVEFTDDDMEDIEKFIKLVAAKRKKYNNLL